MRVGRGYVTPVKSRIPHYGNQAQRNLDSRVIVLRTGLDQAHIFVRVFTQPAGKTTSGGAAANYYVIEVHQAAVQPPSILRLCPVTIAEASDAR